ncbi:hypothetical protein B0T26DRAFT_461282 [Lasiosphaeria miniovina]|uniref:Uncharacterized protein n=1 Tax=Lasiosphaeria miniovina TaxID=1954250 RepID=A0AA40A021_9PEZI|nr:uncharacterized protein B0T26DRAFT_461282 [Lasiosphaeria miniovina]KAK0706569.1 hypothetical protein B0T26DRAFT_461282 [Lasiosphaeria miniovina]
MTEQYDSNQAFSHISPQQKMETPAQAKESKWNNDAHMALCGALAEVMAMNNVLVSKHRDVVIGFLEAKGLDFTWEGIRKTSLRHHVSLRLSAYLSRLPLAVNKAIHDAFMHLGRPCQHGPDDRHVYGVPAFLGPRDPGKDRGAHEGARPRNQLG